MRANSSRALRDQRVYSDDFEDSTNVFVKPIGTFSGSSSKSSNGGSSALFGLLIVTALVVGTFGMPNGERESETSAANRGSMSSFRAKLRSYAAIKLNDNFKSGLNGWVAPRAKGDSFSGASDWSYRDGFVRPASLRLLKDSLPLSNYQLEFAAAVEQKAVNWVYRAKDERNYYASKILITKPGPLPLAELHRWVVVNGAERLRAKVPLPLVIRPDTVYKVQLTARGSDFSTMVNGMMVDTWSDGRLRSGGIGFFSERDEVATLRYVTVTDRDNVLGRMLSYFGFFKVPLPIL